MTFEVPPISDIQLQMVQVLLEWSRGSTQLLLITDWPAFNDHQIELFDDVLGNSKQPLIDWPGFLIRPEDRQKLAPAAFILFAFNWQGYLLDEEHRFFIWFADEVLEVGAPAKTTLSVLEEKLGNLGVDPFN